MKNPDQLPQLRKQLDEIDAQIIELCRQRLQVTTQVFELKQQFSLPVYDEARELEIQSKFEKHLIPLSRPERIKNLVRSILQLSPQYSEKK